MLAESPQRTTLSGAPFSYHLPVADPALKHEITGVLNNGFYALRFPDFLEFFFLGDYRQTALKNLKLNSIYVVITYLLMGGLVFGQFPLAQLGSFTSSYILAGTCLVILIVLTRIPILHPYFHWYSGSLSMLALVAILNVPPTIDNPEIKLAAYAGSIYTIIIIYAMSKMRFFVATFWCLLAGVIHLVLLHLQQMHENFTSFQAYFLAANVIGMGISYIIEHRERAMFLQALLLDIDKIEQERLYQDVQKLSREDPLTGLANRRYFDEKLAQEWSRCRRDNKPLSVILLDIDYFKPYNDFYGHQAGDRCIVQVARALKQEASRTGELVGRYGGEEFILLYPNTGEDQLCTSLQRIRQRINDLKIPHERSSVAPHVTASIGGATVFPSENLLPEKLVNRADKMLYQVKTSGRDGWAHTVMALPAEQVPT